MKPEAVIITGASSGIGFSTAQRFLAAGCRVINLARTHQKMPGLDHLQVDFGQPDWFEACQTALLAWLRRECVITLIHNAGYYGKDRCDEFVYDAFERSWLVNVAAPMRLNQLLCPLMQPGSSILYVGSTLSEKAVAGCASYVIHKHAVLGMMRATTQDLAHRGIHSACICPGFTDTPMLRTHLNQDEALLQTLGHNNAANRLLQPTEIAEVLWFGAQNPSINGSIIHANLGQLEH